MKLIQKTVSSAWFQKIVSTRASSQFVGWLANLELPPWLLRKIINKFLVSYQIDLSHFEKPITAYRTFNEFFCRKLKPEFIHFQDGFCSPVEGTICALGKIQNLEIQQIKGSTYSVVELLKGSEGDDMTNYLTIYLSPTNYHRVHAPIDLELYKVKYISGQKYSTSAQQLERMDAVYCKNERIVLFAKHGNSKLILVFVGAVLVGHIQLSCMETPKPDTEIILDPPVKINKATELGSFKMGSTIVILTDENVDFYPQINQSLKLGETLWK